MYGEERVKVTNNIHRVKIYPKRPRIGANKQYNIYYLFTTEQQ